MSDNTEPDRGRWRGPSRPHAHGPTGEERPRQQVFRYLDIFNPSELAGPVIQTEFVEILQNEGFPATPDNTQVWTYEMPYSLSANDESFGWHTDQGGDSRITTAMWASIYNSDIRCIYTKVEISYPGKGVVVFTDRNFEHRVPRQVETGKGRRWFARACMEGC